MIVSSRLLSLAVRAGATLALTAVAATAWAQTKWDLPAAYPATNFHTENLVQFANDVEKASGGKLKITVHPNASLFKANEIKRAVQGGQAQIGEVLLVNFENENPIYGADGIPFLAASYAESRKLAAAQKPVLDKLLAAQGMMLLYTVPWPPQGIYVKKEIASVADMRGLKWRAYSPATGKIAELIGAQPVTVQAAELSQALATGVVESYMSSGSTGYDSKTYESITPVASACETSAACTVTGCAPTSSAIFDVAGLYARHFRPFMSATLLMGFLLKMPCGGHGTV